MCLGDGVDRLGWREMNKRTIGHLRFCSSSIPGFSTVPGPSPDPCVLPPNFRVASSSALLPPTPVLLAAAGHPFATPGHHVNTETPINGPVTA